MLKKINKEQECEKAILDTLAYRAVFKYSPSFFQLCNLLISSHKFNSQLINKVLQKLIKTKRVVVTRKRLSLPKQTPTNWNLRAKHSQEKIKSESRVLKILKSIPWIKMIGITGSVGAYNASGNDDLDLFIVTQKDRVWLTRGFVGLILILMNKYPKKSTVNKVCPNIYIDETSLEWSGDKQNLYVATDILLLRPYFYKDDMYFHFLEKNLWLQKYFKNFDINFPKRFHMKQTKNSKVVSYLENLARSWQEKFMQKKKSTEVTTKNVIHFNKNDSTSKVLDAYKKIKKSA